MTIKKRLARVGEILLFLAVLAVFLFSLYKILTINGIMKQFAFGTSCPIGNLCNFSCDCDFSCCPICPTRTPTPTLTPTPTELTPTPTEPEPTPTLSVEPTPTPTTPPAVGGKGGGGGGEPPSCGATKPETPNLLSASRVKSDQADLNWTEVGLATYYSIVYGPSAADWLYGVSNTGRTTAFSVGGLNPAANYCFAVRAVNDCQPGDLSNEICLGEKVSGQVLGASTLGATGSLSDQLFEILFIMGAVCLGWGFRKSRLSL